MVSVAVWGASGYAGRELLRLLAGHPRARVVVAASRRPPGERLADLLPSTANAGEVGDAPLVAADAFDRWQDVDVLFCALPHGASAPVVARALQAGCRVIDLGADFRLRDATAYGEWYGFEHPAPELLREAVYGLCEWADPLHGRADALAGGRLVAVPGCYPTGALLSLLPLVAAGVTDGVGLIVDSKSGTSGAGRAPGDALTFSEVHENVRAYKVGRHRHLPEMEQALGGAAVSFTPHLVPMSRGILSTCYAGLAPGASAQGVDEAFAAAYGKAPFVRRAPGGRQPETKWTRGTNDAVLQWQVDERVRRVTVTAAIDNLGKGAAGQAVQCLNRMLGCDETAGLSQGGLVP